MPMETFAGNNYGNNICAYNVADGPNLTRWSYTNSTTQYLRINNGTATMTSSVIGYSGTTTKIEITFDLFKYTGGMWKKVKTYMDTINSWYAAKEHTYSGVDKGYTYRLRCTYKVYSGSNYEYFILYSNEVDY